MILLEASFNQLDTFFGNALYPIFGANLLFAGAFLILMFFWAAVKLNLGWTASITLAAFVVFSLTTYATLSTGNIIPVALGIGFAIIAGFIIFKAFKPDVMGP